MVECFGNLTGDLVLIHTDLTLLEFEHLIALMEIWLLAVFIL